MFDLKKDAAATLSCIKLETGRRIDLGRFSKSGKL